MPAAESRIGNLVQTPPGCVDFPMVKIAGTGPVLRSKRGPKWRLTIRTGRSRRRWRSRKRATSNSSGAATVRLIRRTPACYGFSIIAKVKEGREDAIREHGKTIQAAITDTPEFLAPLRLHYLRWVLFDVGDGLTLPVPGHLRHRLRQVHRGRRQAVRRDAASRPCSPISRASPRIGRRTRTRS